MYVPRHFAEPQVEDMHRLMRAQPLATLVTFSGDGLHANHIPLLLRTSPDPYGMLQGHVPRANPLTSELVEGVETLAIFHGPNGYITPSWYATKKDTGKVVPTWNYAVVHAYGALRVIDDPAWVRAQVEALTDEHEARFKNPWQVSDAPRPFTDELLKHLVGIEIGITRLIGKRKASQNQPQANRAGVVEGLRAFGEGNAQALAALINPEAENDR